MENDAPIARLVGCTVAEVERDLIIYTLSRYRGSRTRAAGVLGLSVRTLRNKIREYTALGIEIPAPGQTGPDPDGLAMSEVGDSAAPAVAPTPRPTTADS